MMPEESVLRFPCRFPIKVMGEIYANIDELVRQTLQAHLKTLDQVEFQSRTSKAGNYVSITAIFTAESQDQLDRIYTVLSQHEKVKYVL